MSSHSRVPSGRLSRLARLAAVGARIGVASLRDGDALSSARNAAIVLGRLRGLAAKVGQMMSYVDGFVPEGQQQVYEQALASLRANAARTSPGQARVVVEQELGASLRELFDTWEEEPIASASIGQVHRARLHDGTRVAVKVQHPDIAKAVESDLANAGVLEAMVETMVGSHFETGRLLEEAKQRFREELDYDLEACRQRSFARLHSGDAHVVVPRVIGSHSRRRVMTSELVDGLSLEQACGASEGERRAWAETMWRFVFRGNLVGGTFNADPHPGNYLFQPDGRVAFLDFGCVQPSRPKAHVWAVAAHRAALQRDDTALREVTLRLLDARPGRHADMVHAFMRACLDPLFSSPYRITRPYVAGLVRQLRASALESRKLAAHEFSAMPEGVLFMNRLQFGFYSVLARLDVAVDYAAVERGFIDEAERSSRDRLRTSQQDVPEDECLKSSGGARLAPARG